MLISNIFACRDVFAQGPFIHPSRDHARVLSSAAPVHEYAHHLDDVFMSELKPLESFFFYSLPPIP
jgi:hypothetical protein